MNCASLEAFNPGSPGLSHCPSSSAAGPPAGPSGEEVCSPPGPATDPLWHLLLLLRGALLFPVGPRVAGRPLRPLHPGAAGGHHGHAGAGAGLGGGRGPVPPAAGQTLRDGRGLRAGNGLLPVRRGGEAVGDTGTPAGTPAGPTGTAGIIIYSRPM